jgi:hypothetical protein
MQYAIYNESGVIDRIMICPAELITLQLKDGESFYEGWVDMETKVIIDGVVCEKPETEEISLADKNIILLEELRSHRDIMLSNSDWTQLFDCQLTDEKKAEWSEYRQQLRDLPHTYANETNSDSVIYPEPPTE